MLKIAEYTQKALELRNRAIKAFNAAGLDIRINENEDTGNIKLVFAGQYSAGKSSILKMLTGRKMHWKKPYMIWSQNQMIRT